MDDYSAIGPMVYWEKMVTAIIVISGVTATLLSTYYSVLGTIAYATFVPPCLLNVTAASIAAMDNSL